MYPDDRIILDELTVFGTAAAFGLAPLALLLHVLRRRRHV